MKKELIAFCVKEKLPTAGSKVELEDRIKTYLTTGVILPITIKVSKQVKDSDSIINKDTLVKNYHNDKKTRAFFIANIGPKFKFNDYLRQYTNPENIAVGLTYGDLLDGWAVFEKNKKENPSNIGAQFQYNQFIRDYFLQHKSATIKQAIEAWYKIKKEKPID